MNHVAKTRHVVLCPCGFIEFQESVELRWNHVTGCHVVLLNELQHLLWSPLVHEDNGVAHVDRRTTKTSYGSVVQRRANDVHVVVLRLNAEQEQDSDQSECALFWGDAEQLAVDALWLTSRARGVVHDVAQGSVFGQRGWLVIAKSGVVVKTNDLANRQAGARSNFCFFCSDEGGVFEPLVSNEDLGARVTNDVANLWSNQVVIDRHEVPARLQTGQVNLEVFHTVWQQGGDDIAWLQPKTTKRVDDLVGPAEQGSCRQLFSIRRHECQVFWLLLR